MISIGIYVRYSIDMGTQSFSIGIRNRSGEGTDGRLSQKINTPSLEKSNSAITFPCSAYRKCIAIGYAQRYVGDPIIRIQRSVLLIYITTEEQPLSFGRVTCSRSLENYKNSYIATRVGSEVQCFSVATSVKFHNRVKIHVVRWVSPYRRYTRY